MQPLIRLTTIFLFSVLLLIASGTVRPNRSGAQYKEKVPFFCSYGEGNRGAELCARIQGRRFESNIHAERAVDMIVKPLGLRRNFVLVPCSYIENAAAVTYEDGVRYIVYDNAFMERIDRGANTDWASVSILAHEIGHHLQGHTTRLVHDPPSQEELRQSRENELEADEFSGFAMFKLGRSLKEAQAAMTNLTDVGDEENSTHPKRRRRLDAIEKGYKEAQTQANSRFPDSEQWAQSIEYDSRFCREYKDYFKNYVGPASWAQPLIGNSETSTIIQDYLICTYELSQPARTFALDFGGATIDFSTIGGSGGGLGLLIYRGEPNYSNLQTWDGHGDPAWAEWWSRFPQSPKSITAPSRQYTVDLGAPTARLSVGVVMVDSWHDTRVSVRVNGLRIRALK